MMYVIDIRALKIFCSYGNLYMNLITKNSWEIIDLQLRNHEIKKI